MGRILCVHRSPGENEGLFHTWATTDSSGGCTWGTPNAMSRSSISGPALISSNQRILCVYGTPEGFLKITAWDAESETWTVDRPVGGNMSDSTVALVAFDHKLFCIHRGYNDTALYYTTSSDDGMSWTADKPLHDGVKSGAGPGAVVINSTLYVVYRDDGPTATSLLGCTFTPASTNPVTPASWSIGYNLATYDLPESSSKPALCSFGGRTYCVHRGAGDSKNGNQIWTCTLTVNDGFIRVDYSDISNQTYQTPSGPAVVTDGTNMWALYGTNNNAQNLYYASWVTQDPWKNSYWTGEANAPDNYLWFEPAALYIA